MVRVKVLEPGDEASAEDFLRRRADTTMLLRSNLARGGLVDRRRTFEGTYAAAFVDGAIEGIAALYWNDNVIVAGGPHVTALVEALAARTARVRGILGTASEVAEARAVVDARFGAEARVEHREILFALSLDELVVPAATAHLASRTPREEELPLVLDWRMIYNAELSNVRDTPEERARQKELVGAFHRDGHDLLLFAGDEPVAYTAFNAEVADMVQVGGVFTPRELRRRGYARAVVAASLVEARGRGAARAILFTGEENVAAQRAYAALGFRVIGDYGIVVYG